MTLGQGYYNTLHNTLLRPDPSSSFIILPSLPIAQTRSPFSAPLFLSLHLEMGGVIFSITNLEQVRVASEDEIPLAAWEYTAIVEIPRGDETLRKHIQAKYPDVYVLFGDDEDSPSFTLGCPLRYLLSLAVATALCHFSLQVQLGLLSAYSLRFEVFSLQLYLGLLLSLR